MSKLSHLLKNPNELLKTPENRAILGGLLLVSVIIIVVAFSFVDKRDKKSTNATPGEKIVADVVTNPGEPTEFEQDMVYSYSGKIINIEGRKLLFETRYIRDLKIIDAVLEATVKEGAEISRRDLYAVYRAGPDADRSVGRELLEFSDLKVGDQMMVISDSNIKDKSSFEVKSVELQYYSQRI